MKKWPRVMALMLLAGGLSGCRPTAEEFDALKAQHEQLQASYNALLMDLGTWSGDVYAWANFTYQTICDIANVNGPLTRYSVEFTQKYCGPGEGNGAPPTPPEWGD